MTTKICGCTAETYGCCESIQVLTPLPTANRPGLSALNYRLGTHGAFLETMKARLTTMIVNVPGTDGQTIETWPLRDLTMRDSSDFSIALLDGWATVADVLTFYQERIANEGYLRTSTERRSILELARLVGYSLRPGVAATVYLAYTIQEDRSVTPPNPVSTTIPKGSRSQSVPDVGELPQSFEISDDLDARSEWNNLQVRLTQPQKITLHNVLAIQEIFVAGTNTKLKAGNSLLFVFSDKSGIDSYVLRTVQSIEAQFDQNRTAIEFQAVSPVIATATPVLAHLVAKTKLLVTANTSAAGHLILEYAQTILTQTYLGGYLERTVDITSWVEGTPGGAVPPLPYNAVGIFAVSDGTNVYCGGGWDGTTVHKDLLRYDPVANSWETGLATMLEPVYRSQAVHFVDPFGNRKIYSVGGKDASGNVTNATRIYDIATNTWGSAPLMRDSLSDMAIGLLNGKIYVAGGYNGSQAVDTLYSYDPATNTWKDEANPMPQKLYAPGFGVINGKLYIAGGTTDGTNVLNTLYIYDIASNTWGTGANLPTAVTAPGSTVFGGKLYLYGGGSPTPTNITQIYNPDSNTWSTGPNLNVNRMWFYGAAVGDTILAPGGEAQNGIPTPANEQLVSEPTPTPTSTPDTWEEFIGGDVDLGQLEAGILKAFNKFKQQLDKILNAPPSPIPSVTDPSKFVTPLLLTQNVQPATSVQLARSLGAAFGVKADANAQLLVKFAPRLSTTFYTAWANATVSRAPSSLKGIFVLGVEAPLFGASAPMMISYNSGNKLSWQEWSLDPSDQDGTSLFLDQAYQGVQTGYVVIQYPQRLSPAYRISWVMPVNTVQTVQRAAYGISGRTTQLMFANVWWNGENIGTSDDLSRLRPVLVRAQTEELTLVEQDISDVNVQGQEIPLDNLYDSLTSGRWMIVSGERADIPSVTGVQASELLMVSGLRQDFDQTLPGDKTRTTLLLATPMAYSYKRETVMIYGNVVKATHGETRNETLGNGDGSQSFQSFTLKQPPLTFVPASNPTGVDSTLEVFVNGVQWQEVDTLVGLGPKDRKFITKTDDDDNTSVIFGNGEDGARLPTGMANVKSVYRSGIGKPGNVKAGQISLLQTRPLGVQSVVNPLPASGGADRENLDQARENAPLGVMSLDRIVSVQDYADFARTFAGIGKAAAQKLSDSKRQLVHVTIAGADDVPIDETSDLYQNLVIALRTFGDPDLPVQVDLRELVVLVLSVNLRLAADYQWEPVVTAVRTMLLDYFGFQNRALGQPAWFSEVISVIQNTAGVEYVEVDAFGGIPQTMVQPDGTRQLPSPDQIAQQVQQILSQMSSVSRVDAKLADFESGALWPAQLAIFTDAVADTLILNQIK